ncbi:hydantoinase/oxoprolinase family protein [Thiocapsa rosea]|uniref:hydantoinase/oxoprolinase family protein n=1 Tax=Thiocapsa rosea TaxID=69360 RepID=UPI001FE9A071|nr:hydantoinase/oxoprolinase family protein [Thiocapsa rosea]
MPHERWLGWDLGGAHLKAVQLDARGRVEAVLLIPCPLWQGLDRLEAGIDRVLECLAIRARRHAITMTGELADLFDGRTEGVAALIACMQGRLAGETIKVYAGTDGLLDPEDALRAASRVASANWLASASMVAARRPAGLLVDIGSTTTDLIPIKEGRVVARGYSDSERLAHGELIYSGVARTPLMALARRAPFGGQWIPLMAEHFATTADVYRLTGDLPEHADLLPSADGREKSRKASAARLARMLGLDAAQADPATWRGLAAHFGERQLRILADTCECLLSRGDLAEDDPIVGCGVGRFLVRKLAKRLNRPYVDFRGLLETTTESASPDVADCAPAAAVAFLAAEMDAR